MSQLKAYPNHSGPIPPSHYKKLYWAFVAYCDEEADAGVYGYGMTPTEAMEDYLRNAAEAICNGCTEDECSNANDCILVEPNFSTYLKAQMPIEDDTTHQVWRELNK